MPDLDAAAAVAGGGGDGAVAVAAAAGGATAAADAARHSLHRRTTPCSRHCPRGCGCGTKLAAVLEGFERATVIFIHRGCAGPKWEKG